MSLLEFENVGRDYAGGHALQGVSFRLAAGEVAALLGPSGAGKTTLLCLAAGLARPTQGRVLFDRKDLAQLPEPQRAALRSEAIGLVFQNNLALSVLPVWENAALPLLMRGDARAEPPKRAESMLERLGLGAFARGATQVLSGGQRRRLGLARAMLGRPRLLLADEPTADLDETTAGEVEKLLFEWLADSGAAALIVTHHDWMARHGTRTLRIEAGRVFEPVSPAAT
jgi:ABC-type lipoprotein export system ATPase subunit